MAEREGFEPPIGLHLCRISSAVHSTTLPPLQAPWRLIPQPRSGRVLGEDGGPDKARNQDFRGPGGSEKEPQNGAFEGSGQRRDVPCRAGRHGQVTAVAAWLARILADLGGRDGAACRSLHASCP